MDVKRSIMLKCREQEGGVLTPLFHTYQLYVVKTLEHIETLYHQYMKIESKDKKCHICKEKKVLNYTNEEKECICTNCFMRSWSEYTLFKNYKSSLVEYSKKIGKPLAHSGFYYGSISTAVKIFKSYIAKYQKREMEIKNAKEQYIIVEGQISSLDYDIKKIKADIKLGKNLTKELIQSENKKDSLYRELKSLRRRVERKHVSFPIFRGNEIYFGKQGMFEFIQLDNKYVLELSDPRILRKKIQLDLIIGDTRKYHKKCRKQLTIQNGLLKCEYCNTFVPKDECKSNHQEQFIQKCIEKKEHKIVYPKLIQSGDEYYFIFPTRDDANIKTKEDIRKWIKEDKDVEYCYLSFGIKVPATLTIIKKNKIMCIKQFGKGDLYQRGEVERKIRANIYNGIGEKYRHNHPHLPEDKILHRKKRVALRKANDKIGFRHQRYCNYYNQKLSFDIIRFIKTNTQKPLIIFRDQKNIKDISYKGELMRMLSRWSVQQQTTFIEYKAYLNNIPIYKIDYKDNKSVKCWKCGKESKEKLTTQILKHQHTFECDECKARYNLHVVQANTLHKKMVEAAT